MAVYAKSVPKLKKNAMQKVGQTKENMICKNKAKNEIKCLCKNRAKSIP